MKKSKRYEVLKSLPPYGPMYVAIKDDDFPFFSEGFVVRFFKDDGTDWVANFKSGWSHINGVYNYPEKNMLLVLAGGLGYIMDPNEKVQVGTLRNVVEEVIEFDTESLIFADNLALHIIDNKKGEVWSTECIAMDGLKNLKLKNDIITGLAYDPIGNPQWSKFSLNLKSKELKGGSYDGFYAYPSNFSLVKPQNENRTKSKKWWEIWRK